jgi:hypothetical protein
MRVSRNSDGDNNSTTLDGCADATELHSYRRYRSSGGGWCWTRWHRACICYEVCDLWCQLLLLLLLCCDVL